MTKMAALAINSKNRYIFSSPEPDGMKHQTILKALQSLYKSFRCDDLDLFYGKINFHVGRPCI